MLKHESVVHMKVYNEAYNIKQIQLTKGQPKF